MKLVCRPFIDLTCSFSFNQSEVKQLDVKWYFKVGFARHSLLHTPLFYFSVFAKPEL